MNGSRKHRGRGICNGRHDRHDAIYHRLFGDPVMVARLLRGFVAGPWLDELDLDGMERLFRLENLPDPERL